MIGLPNERIIIENGEITIYNQANPGGFQPQIKTDKDLLPPQPGSYIDQQISSDQLFVIGDNRLPNISFDSRNFGPIQLNDVVGTLLLKISR